MKIRWAVVVSALFALSPALGQAGTCVGLSGPADVSDDFEGFQTNPAGGESFSLPPGATTDTATFAGQQWAGFAAMGELYASGIRAWMVLPSGLGTVTFDPPASEVLFLAKTHSGSSAGTVIDSVDPSDGLIDSVVLPAGMPGTAPAINGFQTVCLTGAIARIDVTNTDGAQMNSIDNFAYIVPEPSAAFSVGAGIASLLCVGSLRRQRNRTG